MEYEFLDSLSYVSESWFALQSVLEPSCKTTTTISVADVLPVETEADVTTTTTTATEVLAGGRLKKRKAGIEKIAKVKKQLINDKYAEGCITTEAAAMSVPLNKIARSDSTFSHDAMFSTKGREQPISPMSNDKKRSSFFDSQKFGDDVMMLRTSCEKDVDAVVSTPMRKTSSRTQEDESGTDDDSLYSTNHPGTKSKKKATKNSPTKKKQSAAAANGAQFTSSFRGVSCCGKDRKFQARIRDGSKVYYLGRFENEFDAAAKYDEAARQHKGELAISNFMEMSNEEVQELKADYFANSRSFSSRFHALLMPGTLERLELASKNAAAATAMLPRVVVQ